MSLKVKGRKDARTWASTTGISAYAEADRKVREKLLSKK
eukprot:gene4104-14205_t